MAQDNDDNNPENEGAPPREDGAPWRNFYGRRHGKALRKGQIHHLETTLKRVSVPGVEWEDNPDRNELDLPALFGRTAPLVLEIGFGGGEHVLAQALSNPGQDYIGCEPFVNGVAMLLPKLAEADLGNLKIHAGDARHLLDVLPSASVDLAFLLYPDPWPKRKHHRRRYMNTDNLTQLARVLKSGAELRVATDIPDYARHSVEAVNDHPSFSWTALGPADWREPWEGWVRTRYEAKAISAGRKGHYLRFLRA